MGAFSGLNTALTGLQAHKRVIDVIGQNISNVNSPGYSRRQVQLQPSMGLKVASRFDTDYAWNNLGVDIGGVNRYRDGFLDAKARTSMSNSRSADRLDQILGDLETVFAEPSDTGLAGQMAAFWTSFADAANNPGSVSNRTAVLAQAGTLAAGFRKAEGDLRTQLSDLNQQLRISVDRVNELSTQVAEINSEIRAASVSGMDVGDLADKRDLLIDELCTLTGAITRDGAYGQTDVMLGGTPLVNGDHAELMTITNTGPLAPPLDNLNIQTTTLKWVSDGYRVAGFGGDLGALVQGVNDLVPTTLHELNAAAEAMVTNVNTVHRNGQGQAPGDVNLDFWDPAGTTAATLALSSAVDGQPSRIALAAVGGGALDGSNGHLLAAVGEAPMGPDALYRTMIGRLGVAAQTATSRADLQQRFLVEAENQRTSVSGVNLDEEMTHLVMSQRAYEASARLMTAVDELLNTLINRTGAGR